ncbi:hypothetical protein KJ765_04305 [Candidatus Micrarchaeota archaeon]|nr:hypothetical protein [Candidatus Micrarchaeota archaeon]
MSETFAAYFGSTSGSLELTDSMLRVQGPEKKEIQRTHVVELEKLGTAAMGKVSVRMKFYDLFGNAESLEFAMRDAEFQALKQSLGK